jgi:hypothetical protein
MIDRLFSNVTFSGSIMAIFTRVYETTQAAFAGAFEAAASASLIFRAFPRRRLQLSLFVLVPGCLLGVFLSENSKAFTLGSGLRWLDPVPIASVSFVVFATFLLAHARKPRSSARRMAFVSLAYFTVAILAMAVYVVVFLNSSFLPDAPPTGSRPASDFFLMSKVPIFTVRQGVPNVLLTMQLMILFLFLSISRRRWTLGRLLVLIELILASLLTVFTLMSNVGGQRLADVLVATAVALVFSNVSVTVAFMLRSDGARFSRSSADAMAGFICLVLLLWYYSPDHPALHLGGMAYLLSLVGSILIVDDWTHPRRIRSDHASLT